MEDSGLRDLEGRKGGFRIVEVVFDTSALILMFKDAVPVLEQVYSIVESPYIPIVPKPVVKELERLASRGRPGVRRAAKAALNLIIEKFSIADVEGPADRAVEELARRYGFTVVTCDMGLRSRLLSIGVRTIYLRESSFRLESD